MAASLRASDTGKVVTARDAVRLIRDGDTVATGGFVGIGFAENIAVALEELFLERQQEDPHGLGSPRNLSLFYAAGQGDGKDRGLNHLGHDGLVGRVIGGHWGLVPKLQQLAVANRIEAWNLPQGVITHMFRDIAAGKPGTITRVGLGTFVDPRFGGGKLNEKTTRDIVRLMEIDGEEYLFYKTFPVNVGIIRGTTADPDGNITMEKEALTLEAQAIAMAARNSGGTVIVQVERIAERGTLNPRQVKIPGVLVDCVVVAEKPEYHMQTFSEPYSAAFAGEIKVPMSAIAAMPMSERKIIARRAALEFKANSVVNLGIGMPEGVANIAAEEQVIDLMTLTAEPGVIGGFIDISQNAKKVVFVGTFTAGGLDIAVDAGKLLILEEGRSKKFIEEVEHRTFSGAQAAKWGKPVLYITERCVFKLSPEGLELTEIAPGVDLQKDILDQMDFRPIIKAEPTLMDARIFRDEPMNIRPQMLEIPMAERLTYDAGKNLFFVNFEGLNLRSAEDIERIRQAVDDALKTVGHKVNAIVNYDRFTILPELVDDYIGMVKGIVERHYHEVTRYTSNTFLRVKIGEALQKGRLSPHLYETADQAEASLPATGEP